MTDIYSYCKGLRESEGQTAVSLLRPLRWFKMGWMQGQTLNQAHPLSDSTRSFGLALSQVAIAFPSTVYSQLPHHYMLLGYWVIGRAL